ncbi:MAG TPA: glutaredoxin 3 [Sphingomicrobium sp.]|nr:glutaredoxin 3 [Sphingomicrobium sp.]
MPTVEIYTKTYCPYCWRAKELLAAKGVDYQEVTVDFGGEAKQMMVERANGRTTVPQIFIQGCHVGGCDDLVALERAGKLDELISKS